MCLKRDNRLHLRHAFFVLLKPIFVPWPALIANKQSCPVGSLWPFTSKARAFCLENIRSSNDDMCPSMASCGGVNSACHTRAGAQPCLVHFIVVEGLDVSFGCIRRVCACKSQVVWTFSLRPREVSVGNRTNSWPLKQ